MEELARAAGVEPVGAVIQHRARPAMRTYVARERSKRSKVAFKQLGSRLVDRRR